MNKIFLSLVIFGGLLSCQLEDSKKIYVIRGEIQTQSIGLEDVSVLLLKGDQIIATSTGTTFSFSNLQEGTAYTVTPVLNEVEGKNGLSSLDMVSIRKHIEGVEPFDLFQRTAADVNKDNIINQEDLEIIGSCIVSAPGSYTCPTYRFVSAQHDGLSFQYMDQYETDELFADHDVLFIPIKLGDVSGSIIP